MGIPIHSWGSPYTHGDPHTLIGIPIHSWGSPYTHGNPHTLMGIPIPTANPLKRLGLKRCLGFRPPLSGLGLAIAVVPASTPTVLESNLHAARTQTPQFSSGGYTTQQFVRIASRRHSSDRLLRLAGRMSTRSSRLYNRLYRVNTIQYRAVPCPPRGTQLPQFYDPPRPRGTQLPQL